MLTEQGLQSSSNPNLLPTIQKAIQLLWEFTLQHDYIHTTYQTLKGLLYFPRKTTSRGMIGRKANPLYGKQVVRTAIRSKSGCPATALPLARRD